MKAYIFDLDGTLLDSMSLWAQIDADFLKKRGLPVPPDYMEAVSALGFPEAAAYTIARFELRDTVEALLAEWQEMAVYAYGHTVKLKPGAREVLLALKERGAKLGIATSLPEALYAPALRHHGLWTLFDAICATGEVGRDKTSPDVFLLAAQRLGVRPADCVVFEDLFQAIQSAKAAGMTVYGVYDASAQAHWESIREIADGVIVDFQEALSWL